MHLKIIISLLELLYVYTKGVPSLSPPKFVHGINEVWDHVKDGVSEVMDCITLNHEPTVDDVSFYLFTSKNNDVPERILNFTINSKNFNKELHTKILIHGYTQSYKNEILIKMKDAYVKTKLLNVIMVDWQNLSSPSCYPIAADYTDFVGQLTGYLLEKLDPEKVHLIGFSLGAHVAGIGGHMQDPKISRITGLDPAGPMFFGSPTAKRLDKSDAKNVDVIHTSIAGVVTPLGHADFYVNGGKIQPSCSATYVTCSHRRSLQLYLESITSNVGFKATMCDSFYNFENNKCSNNNFTMMGESWLASGALRGTFYLKTNATEPYAIAEQ